MFTACPLDCPDACSLDVTLADGRVARIAGTRRNGVTAGFICDKVRRFGRRLEAPERLLHPAVRSGPKGKGSFRPVSWDEALDLVGSRYAAIREARGGEAILPLSYGGSNGPITQGTADEILFGRLGATRLARTVCAAPSGAAARGLYGKMPGVAYLDFPAARCLVIWGADPATSGIHLVPFVREAIREGARLVVVDPRRTRLAKQADLHLPLRPGTDLVLALGVIDWLFREGRADLDGLEASTHGWRELARRAARWPLARAAAECGLETADVQRFAEWYADASPALVRCGWGLERNRNGGSAVAAVLALPAVAGKFGVRGGGFTMSNSGAWPGTPSVDDPAPERRVVNMNRLGRALLELDAPRVEGLFVYNANPLMTLPDQERVRAGLEREDLFTVVFDQVLTDTARYADVVLPATTFLEHRDLARGYGAYALQRVEPVIEPMGEARSNVEVFTDLARRLDLLEPSDPTTAEAWEERFLSAWPPTFRRELHDEGLARPDFGDRPVQMVDVLPRTPSGRIELVPETLDAEAPGGLYCYRPDPGTERYPLALLSPATRRTVSSTLGELHRDPVALELHPTDAEARGLASGDRVRVWNELGEVRCRVRISPDLRPGVAMLPKGLWSHHTENGATANALAPDSLADLGGGACFNDARVEVESV